MERIVLAAEMLARGVSAQDVRNITEGQASVEWHKVARHDGGLALALLTDAEFDLVKQELIRSGWPAPEQLTRQVVYNYVLTIAENECPAKGTSWYSTELHSAVACAQLLALVQQSFDPETQRQAQLDLFASKLGVASKLEQV